MSVQHLIERVSLPDDREEDLVGTDWHQRAIVNTYDSLFDLSYLTGLPWHVGNQLTLVAWAPDGSPWRPSPDIMVHATAGPEPRKEMRAREDGPPALIIEVASESTWRHDVDIARGKAAGYLALGVQDYLVFDPTGAYLGEPCRGWQVVDGQVRDWRPLPDGRYQSSSLGISFRPEGVFLRVYAQDGRPVAFREERLQEIATLRAELAELRRQLETRSAAPESGDDAPTDARPH
jgi:Uma2 family endonuclease